jgi:hypothetical protein
MHDRAIPTVRKAGLDMSKAVDLWHGPDIKERLERFIQELIDETRSFNVREFAEKFYLVSAPPEATLERCKGL